MNALTAVVMAVGYAALAVTLLVVVTMILPAYLAPQLRAYRERREMRRAVDRYIREERFDRTFSAPRFGVPKERRP